MKTHFSAREVAEEYKVSERTLGRWREEGEGPEYIRLGRRRVAYAAAAVAAWIAARTHSSRAAELAKETAGRVNS
jgi:predicted DNA-binding transcriptional regulator AlpA